MRRHLLFGIVLGLLYSCCGCTYPCQYLYDDFVFYNQVCREEREHGGVDTGVCARCDQAAFEFESCVRYSRRR